MSKKNILIVEDDVTLLRALTEALEEAGYSVTATADGAAALTALHAMPHPSAILLDVVLPILDAFDFRAIQRRIPEYEKVPIVVISAMPGLEEAKHSLGAVEALAKPVPLDVLVKTIQRVRVSARGR